THTAASGGRSGLSSARYARGVRGFDHRPWRREHIEKRPKRRSDARPTCPGEMPVLLVREVMKIDRRRWSNNAISSKVLHAITLKARDGRGFWAKSDFASTARVHTRGRCGRLHAPDGARRARYAFSAHGVEIFDHATARR